MAIGASKGSRAMSARIDYQKAAPGAFQAMLGLEKHVHGCGLEASLLELVKMRASQINGCAHCLDMHSKDARAAGETEQRLYLLNAWREAPFYSARERAALAWTEALTLVAHFELADTTTTATKDTDASMFRVYPNPLTDWMIICGGEKQVHPALVQLLNGMGESVCSERVNPQAGGHFYLKLPDLPTGVYLLKIRPEGEVESALQIVLVK